MDQSPRGICGIILGQSSHNDLYVRGHDPPLLQLVLYLCAFFGDLQLIVDTEVRRGALDSRLTDAKLKRIYEVAG